MRTKRGNMEKRREERELDAEDRFAATTAHNYSQRMKSGILYSSIKGRCLINPNMLVMCP